MEDTLKKAASKRNEEIRKLARPYHELIVPITGGVESIITDIRNTSHIVGEPKMGHNYSEPGGQFVRTEIKIKSQYQMPSKILFDGYVFVTLGQEIVAYVSASKERQENNLGIDVKITDRDYGKIHLVPRELEKVETALAIDVIRSVGRILLRQRTLDEKVLGKIDELYDKHFQTK